MMRKLLCLIPVLVLLTSCLAFGQANQLRIKSLILPANTSPAPCGAGFTVIYHDNATGLVKICQGNVTAVPLLYSSTNVLPVSAGGTNSSTAIACNGCVMYGWNSTNQILQTSNVFWSPSTKVLSVNGISGNYGLQVTNAFGPTNSFGLQVFGGSNSSDAALDIENYNGTTTFFHIDGTGAFTWGLTPTISTVAANFSATRRLPIVIGGTTFYLPMSTVAW